MYTSKVSRRQVYLCVALVVTAGLTHFLSDVFAPWFPGNAFSMMLYVFLFILWNSRMQRRLMDRRIADSITIMVGLMIFWILIRTLRYDYLIPVGTASRYCWYLYYAPFLMIPVCLLYAVMRILVPDEKETSSGWKIAALISGLLCMLVLTNDDHQLAFHFPKGLAYAEYDYSYGPVYFLSILWTIMLFLNMLYIAYQRCSHLDYRKWIWMPMIPPVLLAVYGYGRHLYPDAAFVHIYTLPEFSCIIAILFMESLVQVRLFPSNDHYDSFITSSSIYPGIMNKYDEICYQSESHLDITPEEIHRALHQEVELEDGAVILRSKEISGGYCFWIRDISELVRLRRELKDANESLIDENAMITAENELAEESAKIQEKNRLFKEIKKNISPQLERIGRWIEVEESGKTLSHEDEAIKAICFIGSYIKRVANFTLTADEEGMLQSEELLLALRESCEALSLFGTVTICELHGEEQIPVAQAIELYRFFESSFEGITETIDHIYVVVYVRENGAELRLLMDDSTQVYKVGGDVS